jgi:hypothetical protein
LQEYCKSPFSAFPVKTLICGCFYFELIQNKLIYMANINMLIVNEYYKIGKIKFCILQVLIFMGFRHQFNCIRKYQAQKV